MRSSVSSARVLATCLLAAGCGSNKPDAAAPPVEPLPEPTERVEWVEAPASPRGGEPVGQPAQTAPDPAPQAAPTAKSGSVAQRFVDAHNRYRAKHCAPPLKWSPKLAEVAQKWANSLRNKGCVFGHSPGAKYGENLAAGTAGALDPESTVAMWYDEIKLYKFPNGGFSMETGHFTQVVWTTTKQVGCGHVSCKGNDIYVCNYDPPGNWEGQYRQHVLPASCKK